MSSSVQARTADLVDAGRRMIAAHDYAHGEIAQHAESHHASLAAGRASLDRERKVAEGIAQQNARV